MDARMYRRPATTAVTLAMAGSLALGLMAPAVSVAGHGPCYDGRCRTTVSAPRTIKVISRTFGFGKLKIKQISSRSVKMSAVTTGGAHLIGSTSPGGTVTPDGGPRRLALASRSAVSWSAGRKRLSVTRSRVRGPERDATSAYPSVSRVLNGPGGEADAAERPRCGS